MTQTEEFKRRLCCFQKWILTLQLIIMAMGGCTFALGVTSRPILRISRPELIPTVRWIVNVMVAAGLVQIATAAYGIFCSCWKLIWPILIGIALTGLTVVLELAAVGTSIYLYSRSESIANEAIVHPWYWVECLPYLSCHDTLLRYLHWFVLPQMLLSAATVILQCLGILLLSRMVRAIAEHHNVLHVAQERYHDLYEEKQWAALEHKQKSAPADHHHHHHQDNDDKSNVYTEGPSGSGTATRRSVAGTPRVTFNDEATEHHHHHEQEFEMRRVYHAEIHAVIDCPTTPSSILKTDHGYVAGSRVSLDLDQLSPVNQSHADLSPSPR